MANKPEIVIVGGGIMGCATAYFLGKEGIKSTIIEREAVGSCASGYAAGLLNPLHGHGIPGPVEPLAWAGFKLHHQLIDQLKEESGVDPQFDALPCLWTFHIESQEEECRELYDVARRFEGFPVRWVDDQELHSIEPRLSGAITRGMFLEGIRQVDPYNYTLALAQAAEKHGATITGGTVRGLKRSGERVTAVVTDRGEVACDTVVLAMGPWSAQSGEWLGIPVPVEPLKGQILRLQADTDPLATSVYRIGVGYIAPKPDGLIWAGTTEEKVGFDANPTAAARESIMNIALGIFPFLENARLVLQTACLRPLAVDGFPIIGPVPGWEGVYLATGAGRKGILLGPAMGQAVADMVLRGKTELPVQDFSVSRFARSQVV